MYDECRAVGPTHACCMSTCTCMYVRQCIQDLTSAELLTTAATRGVVASQADPLSLSMQAHSLPPALPACLPACLPGCLSVSPPSLSLPPSLPNKHSCTCLERTQASSAVLRAMAVRESLVSDPIGRRKGINEDGVRGAGGGGAAGGADANLEEDWPPGDGVPVTNDGQSLTALVAAHEIHR